MESDIRPLLGIPPTPSSPHSALRKSDGSEVTDASVSAVISKSRLLLPRKMELFLFSEKKKNPIRGCFCGSAAKKKLGAGRRIAGFKRHGEKVTLVSVVVVVSLSLFLVV